jgi:hypothetical protein
MKQAKQRPYTHNQYKYVAWDGTLHTKPLTPYDLQLRHYYHELRKIQK